MLGRSRHAFFVRADNGKAAVQTCKENGYWNGHESNEPTRMAPVGYFCLGIASPHTLRRTIGYTMMLHVHPLQVHDQAVNRCVRELLSLCQEVAPRSGRR